MKKNKLIGLALAAIYLLFPFNGKAENRENEKSLLWKIEGNGLKQPSYLFGTVHMICSDRFVFPEKVGKAIEATQQSYLEMDLAAPDFAVRAQKEMMSEKTITSQIGKEEAQYVDSLLKQKIGMGLEQMDHMKPLVLVAALLQKSMTCRVVSFEEEVMRRSREKNLPVLGLSSVEEQFGFLEKVFDTKDFPKYLRSMDTVNIEGVLGRLYEGYSNEDLDTINSLMEEFSSANPDGYRNLLPVRNRLWVERLPAIIGEKPTFIAVGCAHLSGEEGMIGLLRKKGYTVTPVH